MHVIDVTVLYEIVDARYFLLLCIREVCSLNCNHRVLVISQSHQIVMIKLGKLEPLRVRGFWLSTARSADGFTDVC